MPELAQRITEYAASVHEANKRTLDPIIVELMPNRRPRYAAVADHRSPYRRRTRSPICSAVMDPQA
jgi:hypothetical protein